MSTIKTVKINNNKVKVNIERYNSAQEVVQDCKTRRNTDSQFHDYEVESINKEFTSVETYQEALDLLSGGYQPTVEKLAVALKNRRVGESKRISFENNIYGFAPIVPLAMQGVPNAMINTTIKPIKSKVIDIYYDITVSCAVTPQEIIENGQKVLSSIVDLEKQGYKFNLYAVQTYSDNYGADVLCVKIKSSDKPLDLKRMSFPLTHPAFFRVIGFDWYGKFPIGKYRNAYGHNISNNTAYHMTKQNVEAIFGKNAVYLAASKILIRDTEYIKEVFTNDKGEH